MTSHEDTALARADEVLAIARLARDDSPNSAVNRAYYAAFYAVTALFLREGCTFSRHSALLSAVHRDLVKSGRWPKRLGQLYGKLFDLRNTGDYDFTVSVTSEQADMAIDAAAEILAAVRNEFT